MINVNPKETLLESLPTPWRDDTLRTQIDKVCKSTNHCVVALDDDPTGTQTVHGVPVVTRWQADDLSRALATGDPALYILTNSRSLSLHEAQEINREIARNLIQAAKVTNRPITIVSRSDSTLRGHFPGEVDALEGALVETSGMQFDGLCIIPFFSEGGRYTINDVHYVDDGEFLVPVAQTPYAKDPVFGYSHSKLPEWVEEKTKGRVKASEVLTISIETIREGGPDAVADQLLQLGEGQVAVVNAASDRDLEVFVWGLKATEAQGKLFIFRTAASFVKVAAGIMDRPLLTRAEVVDDRPEGGGLIVFGSYVQRSTIQLKNVLELRDLHAVEVPVHRALEPDTRPGIIDESSKRINDALKTGKDSLLYTSREVITSPDREENLAIGKAISSALMEIVQLVEIEPRYLIGKGGITSSDLATKGLQVSIAHVLGQIIDGVPVWRLGAGSRWPGVPYVVFPGNVGEPDAVAKVIRSFRT